ncbi:MAG TPA: hypothetical protein VN180_13120, partial [Acidimicrobiia bacterium]|nr:hypothetical protein [Acidimicrobiia bacterium]
MSTRPEAARGELIDRVLAVAGSGVPAGLVSFVRRYFEWVDPDDLAERRPDDLFGAAASHWRLAQHRAPHEPSISVYRP